MNDVIKLPENLVGAWILESYTVKTLSGKTLHIWGTNTAGLLIYLPNGYMSVHVSDQDRPKFRNNDFYSGTRDEIKCAFEGYTTYFGTYEYNPEEGIVVHRVTESLFPNWSGVTQRRFASIAHDKLLLTTPPITIEGEECIMELHWCQLEARGQCGSNFESSIRRDTIRTRA